MGIVVQGMSASRHHRGVRTLIDSNVLAPGSTWELKVSPSGGGSTVDMRLRREFRCDKPRC
jgi:hypothetical protein